MNAEKVVGRVAVAAILVGGSLAALFVYGLTDLLVARGVDIFTAANGNGLIVIDLINKYFGTFGKYFTFILAIGTINDGVLAALALASATSRAIFKMGLEGALPGLFSKQRKGQPLLANLASGLGIVLVSTLVLLPLNSSDAFTALGTVSLFGVLFIYLTANLSLIRVSIRKIRKKFLSGMITAKLSIFRYGEIMLALIAALVTSLVLVFSILSSPLIYVTIFLGWIVVGYIVADVKEIVFQAPPRGRNSGPMGALWERVGGLTAIEIRNELPDVVDRKSDPLKIALEQCVRRDSPAAVVIDQENDPVGTILLHDIVGLSQEELNGHQVGDYALARVAKVDPGERALNLADVFRQTGLPILAVVDIKGKLMGTVREREIIRRLASVQENYFHET